MPVHIRTIRLSHINLYSDISTDKARNLTSNGIDKDTMQTNNDFRQTNLKKSKISIGTILFIIIILAIKQTKEIHIVITKGDIGPKPLYSII